MEHHRSVTVCAGLCPLCGQPNQCARVLTRMAAECVGVASWTCWCATEVFTPGLLQLIPEAAKARACVCQACVDANRTPGLAE